MAASRPLALVSVLLLALATTLRVSASEGPLPDGLYATITTPRGTIVCELHHARAPLTVANFVGLAEGRLGPAPRKPFFDGLTFHRVVPDFVIQGGDPTGTGDGTPGYTFPDELVPGLRHDSAGVLAMANRGPDTNGSQFFLTLRETNRLNYLHSVFGKAIRGLDVLPQIRAGDTMTVKIIRRGAAANAFRADEAAFAALVAQAKRYTAATEPGPTAHFDDPAGLLPAEPPRARNFNFKLANLERATGLRIVGRMFAQAPTDAEDAQPGAFMRALAARHGVAQRGAVVAYFASDDHWRVWIGDESTARFVGRPGTAREFTETGAMHEVKEAFLEQAARTGDAEFARLKAAAPADQPPPPGQRIKLQADALLDGLIFKLEPR